MTIHSQLFEYRTMKQLNDPKQKRAIYLILAIAVASSASIFVITCLKNGLDKSNLLHAFQNFYPSHQYNLASAMRMLYFAGLYMLMTAVPIWFNVEMPKRCTLTLTEDELIHTFRLPFGLNAVIPVDWRIVLRDISSVEFVQPAVFGQFSALAFAVAQLQISQRQGPMRSLKPGMWFIPGSPPRTLLKPVDKPGFFSTGSGVWLKPENQTILKDAFVKMPIVQALRDRGIVIPTPKLPPNYQNDDLFASKAVKFGVVVGAVMIISALCTMFARQNQHLQISFPIWLYLGLGGAGFLLLLLIGQQEQRRPRLFHFIIAFVFFVGGISGAAYPITTLINGIGLEDGEPQNFVVRAASLEPIGHQSGIGTIGPVGEYNRLYWVKDGTTVTLTVTKGRFGLWEYDDSPLRSLADTQGVK